MESGYTDFLKSLVNNEHFDTLINDLRSQLLHSIDSTEVFESQKRETLYFTLKGVDAMKKEIMLLSKRKVTGRKP